MPQEREPRIPAVVAWQARALDRALESGQKPQRICRGLVRLGLAGVLEHLCCQCRLLAKVGHGREGVEPVSFGHFTRRLKEAERGDDQAVGRPGRALAAEHAQVLEYLARPRGEADPVLAEKLAAQRLPAGRLLLERLGPQAAAPAQSSSLVPPLLP